MTLIFKLIISVWGRYFVCSPPGAQKNLAKPLGIREGRKS